MNSPITIVISTEDVEFSKEIKDEFSRNYPDFLALLPNEDGSERAVLAACWHPDPNLLIKHTSVRCLHSLAAGVDHLPPKIIQSGLPICRIVDEGQKQGMFEYVLWGVLGAHRDFDRAQQNQRKKIWQRNVQRCAGDVRIGVLGLGELGGYVAQQLALFGYRVSGWSRSFKNIEGVDCFHDQTGLDIVLRRSDILVNLLPLNAATIGLLNSDNLLKLPPDSYIINCGRGDHVVLDDLISVIKNRHVRGALLDVFTPEPLIESSALWAMDEIIITPHIASEASICAVVEQVAANATRLSHSEPLKNICRRNDQ